MVALTSRRNRFTRDRFIVWKSAGLTEPVGAE